MKITLQTFILSFGLFMVSQNAMAAAALQWTALWVCPVEDCKGCSLSIDLAKREVEYTDSASTHILKQLSVSKTERIFQKDPDDKKGAPGFKAVFNRDNKKIVVTTFSKAGSEERIFFESTCAEGEKPKAKAEPTEAKQAKSYCLQNGGKWQSWTKADAAKNIESCQYRAQDAGASCSDGSDCRNRLCIYDPIKKAATCAEYGNRNGCHQRMVLGKPTEKICID